jgi:hypothetical protein
MSRYDLFDELKVQRAEEEDVAYFRKKVYESLRVPKEYLEGGAPSTLTETCGSCKGHIPRWTPPNSVVRDLLNVEPLPRTNMLKFFPPEEEDDDNEQTITEAVDGEGAGDQGQAQASAVCQERGKSWLEALRSLSPIERARVVDSRRKDPACPRCGYFKDRYVVWCENMLENLISYCTTVRGRWTVAATLFFSYWLTWYLPPGSLVFYLDSLICGFALILTMLVIWRWPWEG